MDGKLTFNPAETDDGIDLYALIQQEEKRREYLRAYSKMSDQEKYEHMDELITILQSMRETTWNEMKNVWEIQDFLKDDAAPNERYMRFVWFMDFQKAIIDHAINKYETHELCLSPKVVADADTFGQIVIRNINEFIKERYTYGGVEDMYGVPEQISEVYENLATLYAVIRAKLHWPGSPRIRGIRQNIPDYGLTIELDQDMHYPSTLKPNHYYLMIYTGNDRKISSCYDLGDSGFRFLRLNRITEDINRHIIVTIAKIGEVPYRLYNTAEVEFPAKEFRMDDAVTYYELFRPARDEFTSIEIGNAFSKISIAADDGTFSWILTPKDILKAEFGRIWNIDVEDGDALREQIVEGDSKRLIDLMEKNDLLVFRTPSQFNRRELSYGHVLNMIDDVCSEPLFTKIYMTIYRTEKDSRVINSLLNAAKRGAEVHVYIEIQARGDEQRNIEQIGKLAEYPNVHVHVDFKWMKVHAKLFLALADEEHGIVHFSTGNYNAENGKRYVDTQIVSTRKEHIQYAKNLMDAIIKQELISYISKGDGEPMIPVTSDVLPMTGYSNVNAVRYTLLQEIHKMINSDPVTSGDREIIFKCNHLTDREIIKALEQAAADNVKVTIYCRSTIGIRPVRKARNSIKVFRIIGKYLEHDRFYYFSMKGYKKTYFSSADLLYRNLFKRVESLVEIDDPYGKVMAQYFRDFAKVTKGNNPNQTTYSITQEKFDEVTTDKFEF